MFGCQPARRAVITQAVYCKIAHTYDVSFGHEINFISWRDFSQRELKRRKKTGECDKGLYRSRLLN